MSTVGLINLARQGSVRIRRSIRVRASLKKDDMENQNHTGLNSEENLVDVSLSNYNHLMYSGTSVLNQKYMYMYMQVLRYMYMYM